MGESKSALSAELPDLSRLDEVLVQKDLISLERNGALDPHFLSDIFCVGIRRQTADTPIG